MELSRGFAQLKPFGAHLRLCEMRSGTAAWEVELRLNSDDLARTNEFDMREAGRNEP